MKKSVGLILVSLLFVSVLSVSLISANFFGSWFDEFSGNKIAGNVVSNITQPSMCGDGVKNQLGEECDSSDFGGKTCEILGWDGGTLGCGSNCKFVTTACVNGIRIFGCSLIGQNVIDLSNQLTPYVTYAENNGVSTGAFFIIPGHLMRATEIYNDSAGYINDRVRFGDYDHGKVYDGLIISEGNGKFSLDGISYPFKYSKPLTVGYGYVRVDFPQTEGADKLIFTQPSGAKCINQTAGFCGDYLINQLSEECDKTYFNGNTCQMLGFSSGTLRCGSTCKFDASGCTTATPSTTTIQKTCEQTRILKKQTNLNRCVELETKTNVKSYWSCSISSGGRPRCGTYYDYNCVKTIQTSCSANAACPAGSVEKSSAVCNPNAKKYTFVIASNVRASQSPPYQECSFDVSGDKDYDSTKKIIPTEPAGTFCIDNTQSDEDRTYYDVYRVDISTGTITGGGNVTISNATTTTAQFLKEMGAISWYKMEGNAKDSIRGNSGIAQGNMTFASGKHGNAANFDGINDYIDMSANPVLLKYNNFSISFWLKKSNARFENILAYARGGSSGTIDIDRNPNKLRFESFTNNKYQPESISTGINVSDGNWHNFVVVSSPNEFVLYTDGIKSYSTTPNKDTANQIFRYIGNQQLQPSYGNWLTGQMDELIFFNNSLSASQIKTLYNLDGFITESV